MKESLFIFVYLFYSFAFTQVNKVGYYIDAKGERTDIYELETKKDSSHFMTPNIFFWNKDGVKKRVNTNRFKEFKINNAFYKSYEYYKDEKKLNKGKIKNGFGQLLVFSDKFKMFYSVSNIQATKGNPIGTITIIDKKRVLKEKFSFSKSSLSQKLLELNNLMNRYFPKCANLFNSFYYELPETTKNLIFNNYIFNQFVPSNCNNE